MRLGIPLITPQFGDSLHRQKTPPKGATGNTASSQKADTFHLQWRQNVEATVQRLKAEREAQAEFEPTLFSQRLREMIANRRTGTVFAGEVLLVPGEEAQQEFPRYIKQMKGLLKNITRTKLDDPAAGLLQEEIKKDKTILLPEVPPRLDKELVHYEIQMDEKTYAKITIADELDQPGGELRTTFELYSNDGRMGSNIHITLEKAPPVEGKPPELRVKRAYGLVPAEFIDTGRNFSDLGEFRTYGTDDLKLLSYLPGEHSENAPNQAFRTALADLALLIKKMAHYAGHA